MRIVFYDSTLPKNKHTTHKFRCNSIFVLSNQDSYLLQHIAVSAKHWFPLCQEIQCFILFSSSWFTKYQAIQVFEESKRYLSRTRISIALKKWPWGLFCTWHKEMPWLLTPLVPLSAPFSPSSHWSLAKTSTAAASVMLPASLPLVVNVLLYDSLEDIWCLAFAGPDIDSGHDQLLRMLFSLESFINAKSKAAASWSWCFMMPSKIQFVRFNP